MTFVFKLMLLPFQKAALNFLFLIYCNSITLSSPSEDELPPEVESPLEEEPEFPPLGVLLLPEFTAELPEVDGAVAFFPSTSRL